MNAIITFTITNIFHVIWLNNIVAEPRYSRKKTLLIIAGTTLVFQFISLISFYLRVTDIIPYENTSITTSYFIVAMLGTVLYVIVFCFVISASHPVKSLFLLTGYFSTWAIISGITAITVSSYPGSGNALIWGLRIGLNLAVLIPYLLFFKDRLFQLYKEITSGYGLISTLSFMCFFMQLLLLFYNGRTRSREPLFVILVLSIFVFIATVYIMVFRHMAQSDHDKRMRQLQANEKFLLAQIDSYKKMNENVRQTRHDFRHHAMVITEYAKNQDYEGILSYLAEYNKKEQEKYQETFCKNHAANTVLSAYASRCEQHGIHFHMDVLLKEPEKISDYDLVTILANILENAVNGCLETERKRKIDLFVRHKVNKLVMVCKNTCAPDIPFTDGLPENKERGGAGVMSILNTAAKYDGMADFSVSEGTFICRIILNSRKA